MQKHFIISLTEDLTVSKTSGKLTRNSNGTQWIDVELDGWKLSEGAALYIELSHLDGDSGLTSIVGPINVIFNPETGRYVTLAPPELITVAGKWNYSIELRYAITDKSGEDTRKSEISVADGEGVLYKTTVIKGLDKSTGLPTEITVKTDKDGDVISTSTVVGAGEEKVLTYNSLTSAVYQLEVIDTVISSGAGNSFTREAELLTAAETLTEAILAGHSAEEALAAARAALKSEQSAAFSESNAALSAESASGSAQAAASSEASAQSAAAVATDVTEEATRQAANSAASATAARNAQISATEQATAAANSAEQAATSEQNAANSAADAESAKQAAQTSATEAHSWADIARQWADYGIKINTEYTSLEELPDPGDSHFIYLIPNGSTGENGYDEYIWADVKSAYEKIGTTEIDLTAYATKVLLADGLAEKVSKTGDAMTGALKTPKINVDKIARNEADFIYVEPKTEFHSGVTFDQGIKTEKICANTISDNNTASEEGNGITVTSPINFLSTVSTENLLKVDKLRVSDIGVRDSSEIQLSSSVRGNGDTDIKGIDVLTANQVNLVGGDTRIYRTDENSKQVLNLYGEQVAIKSNLTVDGAIYDHNDRVYSPNNKPAMHLELVQKSRLYCSGGGEMRIIDGGSEEEAKANLKAKGYNLNGFYLAQRVEGIYYPSEIVRIGKGEEVDADGEYCGDYYYFTEVTQGNGYYNIYEIKVIID